MERLELEQRCADPHRAFRGPARAVSSAPPPQCAKPSAASAWCCAWNGLAWSVESAPNVAPRRRRLSVVHPVQGGGIQRRDSLLERLELEHRDQRHDEQPQRRKLSLDVIVQGSGRFRHDSILGRNELDFRHEQHQLPTSGRELPLDLALQSGGQRGVIQSWNGTTWSGDTSGTPSLLGGVAALRPRCARRWAPAARCARGTVPPGLAIRAPPRAA